MISRKPKLLIFQIAEVGDGHVVEPLPETEVQIKEVEKRAATKRSTKESEVEKEKEAPAKKRGRKPKQAAAALLKE